VALVLVVDDHPSNRDLVTTLLGYGGHRFIEASDGAEALVQTRAERPDLVICDILMPRMDGYEFVRRLRADPVIAATHVVFYTATFMEGEARALARSCGVSLVLTKPCEPQEILRTVDRALSRHEVTDGPPDDAAFDREHLRLITDKLVAKANELEAANQRLSSLIGLNLELASEHDPYTLLAKVCLGARDLLGSRAAVLRARQKDRDGQASFVTVGLAEADVELLRKLPPDAGPLGEVMRERRARRIVNPPPGDPAAAGFPIDHPAFRSALLAPIVSLHHAYGTIMLIDKAGAAAFTEEEERILSTYAAQAGRIYENGSLYTELRVRAQELEHEIDERRRAEESLRQHAQRLQTLHGLDQEILAAGSPAGIAASVLGYVREVIPCQRASVLLFDYERQEARVLATHTDEVGRGRTGLSRLPLDDAIMGEMRQGEVHVVDDITVPGVVAPHGADLAAEGLRSLMSVPLLSRGELIGALTLWNAVPASFQPAHVTLAQEVAAPLSIGIAQARLLEQVRQNAAALELRVRERTAQLEAVNDELESFSFSVSHDLQAPLRQLQGFAQILIDEHTSQLDEAGRVHVHRLQTAAQRMQALITDLLSLSGVARLELQAELVDLSALVAELVAELREGQPVRQVDVQIAPGVVGSGDRRLLRVALGNLLDNAWKYTGRHEAARVAFGVVERDGRPVYFVRDDGAGFDMEHAGRLFGAFHRLHSAAEFDGTGIGLATVQRIVRRHGGRIWAESAVEQGATFYFTLADPPG